MIKNYHRLDKMERLLGGTDQILGTGAQTGFPKKYSHVPADVLIRRLRV